MSSSSNTAITYPIPAGSSPSSLYRSLLRPPILHILRAAGFHSTRPSVLDTLVDLTARYLELLAGSAAANADLPSAPPTLVDIRLAMQECGVFAPQHNIAEDFAWYETDEDLRGVEAFRDWVQGDGNREIRRIAGLKDPASSTSILPGPNEIKAEIPAVAGRKVDTVREAEQLLQTGGQEDFLTVSKVLKKKHNKTGEESRFQGTVLGKAIDDRPVRIEGGTVGSIEEWMSAQARESQARSAAAAEAAALKRAKMRTETEKDEDQVMGGS
ncbi:MAG: hypothetical protein M4579_001461 [Chaenotheca gracillima]|nr:MAG: hypothetical protein M4579_001461 [Chaenotheca gracillima]